MRFCFSHLMLACLLVSSLITYCLSIYDFMCIATLTFLGDTILQQISHSAISHRLPALSSTMFPELRFRHHVIDISGGAGHYISAFCFAVVFCNDLHLLQEEISLMRSETCIYLWYKNKYLESS